MTGLQRRLVGLAGRWLVTGLVIGLVVQAVDGPALWRELSGIALWVLVPALLLSVLQVVTSAWRWRYTARRLGVPLRLGLAVQEYYLATFLNQVLPGGVLGDVHRAWRHGTSAGERLAAAHAVAIERLSGQVALLLVVLASVIGLVQAGRLHVGAPGGGWWPVVAIAILGLAVWLAARLGAGDYLVRLRRDLHRALLSGATLPVQMASSLLVLASYLGVFLLLAAGAGYLAGLAPSLVLVGLCSVLLLSMVIPLTVAGWGVREGTAAVLWPLAGLPAEQGVALSVGYGALVLISSLPGAAMIFMGRGRARNVRRSGA